MDVNNNKKPIGERKTDQTNHLQKKVDEYIVGNTVPISSIDISINVTSPFPTLSGANKTNFIPIVDPHTMFHLVEESLEGENDEKIDNNATILFESQALRVIQGAFDGLIDILQAVLEDYHPTFKDFEKTFLQVLGEKQKISGEELEIKQIDDIFNDMTARIEEE